MAEDWRERTLAAVHENKRRRKRQTERRNAMTLFYDDGLRELLDTAARRRNISLSGYIRRALVAFIAWDLGMDIGDVARHTATPAGYGATPGGRLKRTHDDARGRGPWRITGLGEA